MLRFKKHAPPRFLGFACMLVIVLSQILIIPILTKSINNLDNFIYDKIVQLNWHKDLKQVRVIIVDIDTKSMNNIGKWPWTRDKLASLVDQLKKSGVALIAFDIVMTEPSINYALGLKSKVLELQNKQQAGNFIQHLNQLAPQVDNDKILAKSLYSHDTVLGFLFHNDKDAIKGTLPTAIHIYNAKRNLNSFKFNSYNGNLNLLANAAKDSGFVTNLPDNDGIIRHGLLLATYNGKYYPSLALAIAKNYLLADRLSLVLDESKSKIKGLNLDGIFIPSNEKLQILIPFWGTPGTLDYYSASDIMQGKVAKNELEGAIAVIGSSMMLLSDLHPSPVSPLFPGVELVGNMAKGIIEQSLIIQFDWHSWYGYIILFIFGLVLAFVLPSIGIFSMLVITLSTTLSLIGLSIFLFVYDNYYLPIATMLFIVIFLYLLNHSYAFAVERKLKRKISNLFGQYVPPNYVKELIESPNDSSMEGKERNMTVLFADIRNFTNTCEGLSASEVKQLLNEFFTPITEIIFKHNGTIDKYVGDMIIAFWGAPIKDKNHKKNALNAALAVTQKLPQINQHLASIKLPQVNIGIGLASGIMNVGDMGSKFRRSYTVLGDTVNLASRLESLTKYYQKEILVNEELHSDKDDYLWRTIDVVAVKGKKRPTTIYQPLGLKNQSSKELITEINAYEAALAEYKNQNFNDAKRLFTDLSRQHPDSELYRIYLARIHEFLENPPPTDWNGVYVHTQK